MSLESGSENVFSLDNSLQSDFSQQIEVSDSQKLGQDYDITVLALAPNYQCAIKEFTVSLIGCDLNSFETHDGYQLMEATVRGSTVTSLAPSYSLKLSQIDCGPIAHEIIWPVDATTVQSIVTIDEGSGVVSVSSQKDSDAGTYSLQVRSYLSDYPNI